MTRSRRAAWATVRALVSVAVASPSLDATSGR